MPYVILWRKKGKYVARFGSSPANTKSLDEAHRFTTRGEAELNRLPESEVVVPLEEVET